MVSSVIAPLANNEMYVHERQPQGQQDNVHEREPQGQQDNLQKYLNGVHYIIHRKGINNWRTHTHRHVRNCTTEWETINYGSCSCLDPKKGTTKEQSLPRPLPQFPWVGSSAWQWSARHWRPEHSLFPQEEESLNIWLLTRQELYTREVATLAWVGSRAQLAL